MRPHTAYLLACYDVAEDKLLGVGIFSESRPTTMRPNQRWLIIDKLQGRTYQEASDYVRASMRPGSWNACWSKYLFKNRS